MSFNIPVQGQAFNHSTPASKAGRSQVIGQPELYCETLPQNKRTSKQASKPTQCNSSQKFKKATLKLIWKHKRIQKLKIAKRSLNDENARHHHPRFQVILQSYNNKTSNWHKNSQ